MFLIKLTIVLLCVLGVETLLIMLYLKFKIKAITKKLNKFKKNIDGDMSFLKSDSVRHEKWISTLSVKIDAFEITGKVRKIGTKNESNN